MTPKGLQSTQLRHLAGQSTRGVWGYLIAVGGVALSTMLSLNMGSISREAPFLMFLPTVLLTLWYAGFRPAFTAIVLSGLAADYFLISPLYTLSLDRSGIIKEVVFGVGLGLSCWMIDRARRDAVKQIALRDRMMESSPQPIFITGLDHRVVYWNAGAAAVFGWSEMEVLGRNISRLLLTEFPEPLAELDRRLQNEGSWRGILRRRSKRGEPIVTESNWTYDAASGSILQTDLVITDRIRAEQAALASAAKLEAAIRSSRDAFLICDTQGNVVEWNDAYARFLRIKHPAPDAAAIEESFNLIDVFYPSGEHVPHTHGPRMRALAGETVSQLELELCRRDTGETWTGSYSFSPLRDHEGKTIGAVVTARDITKAHEMERELRRVNRALGAITRVNQVLVQSQSMSEERLYQRAVEVIAGESGYPLAWVGVPEQDEEKSIRAIAVAGRASNFVQGLKLSWGEAQVPQCPVGSVLREGEMHVVQDYLTDPSTAPWAPAAAQYGFRSMTAHPLNVDGSTVAVLTVYSEQFGAFDHHEVEMLADLAGDLAFGIASIRSRRAVEEERQRRLLVEAQLQQAQKLEAIGTLAGGIAHDFNNLLMVIMAQIEALSLDLEGPQVQRAAAVQKSASRAAELTSQLLAFSRKQVTQPTVTDLNHILQDFLPMTTRLLREDIEMKVSLCEKAWPVKIDRSQFEQVVMNLVVNARDAMPDGGRLMLETDNVIVDDEYIQTHPLVPPGHYSLCALTDTGAGMTPEVQAHIFEPFYTTKGVGKGTGLGLAMVYGIVKQAGGFIWVYSEPGKGSSFKIYLPVAEESVVSAEEPISGPAHARHKARILLVEDDPSLRGIILEFLESSGHEVVAAESPQEAAEVAGRSNPPIEILVTDVVLKGGNGKVLAERLCAMDKRLQVIFMSGYTPNAIVHHGVLEPGVHFLQKPFSKVALLGKIDDILDKSQRAQAVPPELRQTRAGSSGER